MVKIGKNGKNGLKWSKMVPDGPKWFKMVKMNGAKDEVKRPERPPARSQGPEGP